MNTKETDISRDPKGWDNYPKDDPEQTQEVWILFAAVVNILFILATGLFMLFGRLGVWDNI